jgi:hypothetical protein
VHKSGEHDLLVAGGAGDRAGAGAVLAPMDVKLLRLAAWWVQVWV